MNATDTKMQRLRERARAALARGDLTVELTNAHYDDARAAENLRIYHAELEIQNQELKESQAEANEQRRRYQTLFNAMPIPALVIDRMGVIADTNRAAQSFFGFRRAQGLHRHSVFRLLHNRGGDWIGDALQLGADEPPKLAEQVPVLRGDGEQVPMDCIVVGLGTGYHADRHQMMLLVDRSAEHLREQERLFHQTLIDNSQSLIFAFDRSERCLLMNQEAGRVFGIAPETAVGLPREHCVPARLAEREAEFHRQALSSPSALVEEYRGSLGADVIPETVHTITRFRLRDERGYPFAVATIATDISRSRRMEVRLDLASEIFKHGSEGIVITDARHAVLFTNPALSAICGLDEAEVAKTGLLALLFGPDATGFPPAIEARLATEGFWEGEVRPHRNLCPLSIAWLRVSRVRAAGVIGHHHIFVLRDLSRQKQAEEELERLAHYDLLTGTPNRYLLEDRVHQAIREARRQHEDFALAFVDLDRFKDVNDVFGHATGDRLLVEFTRRLQEHLRDEDTVSRLGGDEFVLLLRRIDRRSAGQKISGVLDSATEPFLVDGHRHQVSASVGIAMFPQDGDSLEELLRAADTAMYHAKENGRNRFSFFAPQMRDAIVGTTEIATEMREALRSQQFHMVYQPQIDLVSRQTIGAEALARWQHHRLGPISPGRFIPVAEQCGLIRAFGNWVLDHVIAQVQAWSSQGLGSIPISVNVAAEQLGQEQFAEDLLERIAATGIDGGLIGLELTERTAMGQPGPVSAVLKALTEHGVSFSLDDFGTGYSSLSYLKRFPIDFIKIDRSFVTEVATNPDDQAICKAIIQMAHVLGMKVIAEGVETRAQEAFLRDSGCDAAQGFLYSPGIPADAFARWLRDRDKALGIQP